MFPGKIFSLLFMLLCLAPVTGWAMDIVIVRESDHAAYTTAMDGVLQAVDCPVGSKIPCVLTTDLFSMANDGAGPLLAERLHNRPPELIVAMGREALLHLAQVDSIPIVHLLAAHPPTDIVSKANVRGIGLDVPAAQQLAALLSRFPGVRRLGLLYDPRRSGTLAAESRLSAADRGIVLESRPVASQQEALKAAEALATHVDGFWLMPDLTVTQPAVLAAIEGICQNRNLPVLAFAHHYLRKGASLSVYYDIFDMGLSAGRLAKQLLRGSYHSDSAAKYQPKVRVRLAASDLP